MSSRTQVDGTSGRHPLLSHAAAFLLIAVCLVWAATRAYADDSPTMLVREADHVLRGSTTAGVVGMQIHTNQFDRSYDMVYWEDARGSQNKVLVKVLGPAEWRGHGTLKANGRVTLYNPNTDRMTSLSNSMLGDSWMGSHFNNDDFVKETDLARDYTARDARTWTGRNPSGTADVTFHQLELTPLPTAPVSWARISMQVYREGITTIPVRFDYYQRADGGITRTLSFSEVRQIGGRLAPTMLTMTVADKPGEWTRVVYEKLRFDADIPADKFSEQSLRQ